MSRFSSNSTWRKPANFQMIGEAAGRLVAVNWLRRPKSVCRPKGSSRRARTRIGEENNRFLPSHRVVESRPNNRQAIGQIGRCMDRSLFELEVIHVETASCSFVETSIDAEAARRLAAGNQLLFMVRAENRE